ncbi:hypothetical protein [Rickettsiales endosymbiont of Stachyamoeba lipophora]|uniref:hypothetical protein n=1 Tax=Rickettsiales endosymbiont of Stachyamoeba lipophora TaxID=2486578 RepID=UPI000F6488FE|nr:hypothetical protein [Rickettsiales endosymbiont of Stachyamoeba lipophora]AZL15072.1 hypothetical protein EF513_00645 [Rickettsiales endosymbiont of Stachyamoeba lipophora]
MNILNSTTNYQDIENVKQQITLMHDFDQKIRCELVKNSVELLNEEEVREVVSKMDESYK